MSRATSPVDEAAFREVAQALLEGTPAGEHVVLDYRAESGSFTRVNAAKVRQTGHVEVGELGLTLVVEGEGGLREAQKAVPLTGDPARDVATAREALARARAEARTLPVAPFAVVPKRAESSRMAAAPSLGPSEAIVGDVLASVRGLDFAGIVAAGTVVRANASSAGHVHWFSSDRLTIDWSLYAPGGQAHKASFAGARFDREVWERDLAAARRTVELLGRPAREVPRGETRVWLAPAAVAEILAMLSWGCVGEASIRQGDSALRHVRSGAKGFSPLFSLADDFRGGDVPRWNDEGELAPEVVRIVERGELVGTLVSSRTAKEHSIASNGASSAEGMRAPTVGAGELADADVLARLGDGVWVSNLWYLNWSDQPGGRITGMTRYACFAVEGGVPVAPIRHVRFDDTIFRMLGSELEAVGRDVRVLADTGSYEFRDVGATRTPGLLLRALAVTL